LLAAALSFHAGQQPFSFVASHITAQVDVESKTIRGLVWYPVDAGVAEQPQWIGESGNHLFQAGNAAVGAPIAASPQKFPLILLSHGSGGSARQMAWLGTALARAGYIAVAIDHPGNTGAGEPTVQGFTLWWLRARELSMSLDTVLADPVFAPHIDRSRIGAAGFSVGGYTVIGLAGARVDFAALQAFCAKNPRVGNCQSPPEFPGLVTKMSALLKSDPAYASAVAKSNDSVADPRVRAVYAIAPSAVDSVTLASLKKIAVPVRIAFGSNDTTLAPRQNALRYANAIRGATVLSIPGAGHYTFLDTCTTAGKRTIPGPVCNDARGLDRSAAHAQVVNDAIAFFERTLNP